MANGGSPSPLEILAYGVAGSLVGAVVFGGAYLVLPVTCHALGVAWSIATTGAVTGVQLSPALATWASVGLAGVGGSATVLVLNRFVVNVSSDPFRWSLPMLGVLNGTLMTLMQDVYSGSKVTWAAASGLSAFFVVAAGALDQQKALRWRVVGVLLHLAVPLVVLAAIIAGNDGSLSTAFQQVHMLDWVLMAGLVGIGVTVYAAAR
jgi:hypothetical protein